MQRRFPAGLLIATGVISTGLAACGKPPAPPPPGPPEVGFVTLQGQDVPLTVDLPGRTTSYTVSDVRPQVNGILKARLFVEGSEVKAGQVLYQIDPAPYQAAYDQAKATLANAQANLTTTKLKADRYADLVKINAVSKQDFDDADAAYKQALATVEQDKASLESADINLGYTKVRAPITGRIGRTAYTAGALLTANQTNALATIEALDPIYVDVTQSSDEILKLKQKVADKAVGSAGSDHAKVKLTLSDGSVYPQDGDLRFSDPMVDPTTGSVTLRAVFRNPQATLLPGMYVRETVTQANAPNGLLVPQQAVTRDPKGVASVFVVDAQNKAVPHQVAIVEAIGDKWLVSDGIQSGDHVIVEGLLKVQPGIAVKPVPAGSITAPAPAAAAH
jgi:membrane fusion protein, multidrug efflux system